LGDLRHHFSFLDFCIPLSIKWWDWLHKTITRLSSERKEMLFLQLIGSFWIGSDPYICTRGAPVTRNGLSLPLHICPKPSISQETLLPFPLSRHPQIFTNLAFTSCFVDGCPPLTCHSPVSAWAVSQMQVRDHLVFRVAWIKRAVPVRQFESLPTREWKTVWANTISQTKEAEVDSVL
jgi:hypothetical protein